MTGAVLEQDQRFTLEPTDRWARQLAGVRRWTLDVAACRQSHLAPRYFTARENALLRPWKSRAVWANIPFSDIAPWLWRAWAAMQLGEAGLIAMLLPATRTEQPWWQEHVEPWRDRGPRETASGPVWLTSHFPAGRTRFGNPRDPLGLKVGSPDFTCALLVFRRQPMLVQAPGRGSGHRHHPIIPERPMAKQPVQARPCAGGDTAGDGCHSLWGAKQDRNRPLRVLGPLA